MTQQIAGQPAISLISAQLLLKGFLKENRYFPPPPSASPPGSPLTTPTQQVDWKWSRAGDKAEGGGGIREKGMGKDNKLNNGDVLDMRDVKGEEIYRITVSKLGQDTLTAILDKANDGFIGGKISRTHAANWIMKRFYENLNDEVIKEIRMDHYDEVAILESILCQAKESGHVPTEFKALLQMQLGKMDQPKKKSKKALTENIINDDIEL